MSSTENSRTATARACCPRRSTQLGVRHRPPYCIGQRLRVVGVDEEPGLAVDENVRDAPDPRRDDGSAELHRLEEDEREPLVARRQQQHVELDEEAVPVDVAEERHAVTEAERPGAGLERDPVGTVARDPQDAALNLAERCERDVDALLMDEPAEDPEPHRTVVRRALDDAGIGDGVGHDGDRRVGDAREPRHRVRRRRSDRDARHGARRD